ncbi:MAG: hypothetical protein P8188_11625 [Gemmatimonadota bacterium]
MATGGRKKKRKTGKGRGKSSRQSSDGLTLLSREQERDLLGICLLVLALFAFLSLVPVEWFGVRGTEWFPSGNLVGMLGGSVQGLLRALAGNGAVLVPVLLVLAGLWAGEWMSTERTLRLLVLDLGLIVAVPVAAEIWVGAGRGGWIGTGLGAPLLTGIGWLGATVALLAFLVALSVGTLGWNPVRTLAGGVARGSEAAREAAREAADRLAARAAAQSSASAGDEPLPSHEWTGPEAVEEDEEEEPSILEELEAAESQAPVPVSEAREDLPDPADPRDLKGGSLPPRDLLTLEEMENRAHMERELDGLGQVLVEKLRLRSSLVRKELSRWGWERT